MPKKPEPTHASEILARLVESTKVGQTLEHAQVWEHWESIVGKAMAPHCQPVWIRDGQLRIEANSSVNLHKLAYRQWDIIQRVNRLAKKELIHDIYVVLCAEDDSAQK